MKSIFWVSFFVLFIGYGSARAEKFHSGGAHWDYVGKTGAKFWGGLDPKYATCKSGKAQSPIDLIGGKATTLPALKFMYRYEPVQIEDDEHTIQVNPPHGNAMMVGNDGYELSQYHFHVPSEHLLNKKRFDMELHLVHRDSAGNLAVVGIFIKKGRPHAALDAIFRDLPTKQGQIVAPPWVSVNPTDFLPKNLSYYTYAGSLTAPPCGENVRWIVLATPIEISAQQLQEFRKVFKNNSRPVQPLNGRSVQHS